MGKIFTAIAMLLLSAALSAHSPVLAKAAPTAGAERTAPWNSETTELEADNRIVYGRLPNGLRYAIRRNERPENQVLVRLAFEFGSAAEADDEQGLAHFIEHMAFNGIDQCTRRRNGPHPGTSGPFVRRRHQRVDRICPHTI
jgi:zinc protease